MKSIELCVIADRFCPTSRTYLTYLRHAGYRVTTVILVDFIGAHDSSRAKMRRWGRLVGGYLKQRVRLPDRSYPPDFRALCDRLQKDLPTRVDYFEPFNFADHCDTLIRGVAESYDDPDLHRMVSARGPGTFLYTNGGRVPSALLDRPGIRILHIHPGVVPEVKGSDCLFWSVLTRGRPGMSCFYMNAGIDTGDILHTREFASPHYPDLAETFERDPELAYRALLHAYDPHLRAMTLLEVVEKANGAPLDRLPSQRQLPGSGRTYYWMHPRLTRVVLRRIASGPAA